MSDTEPALDEAPRDQLRMHLIWTNILEALNNDDITAMHEAQQFAEQSDDPIGEVMLLFTATAGLLGRYFERYLGPDQAREFLNLTLLENDLADPPAKNNDQ